MLAADESRFHAHEFSLEIRVVEQRRILEHSGADQRDGKIPQATARNSAQAAGECLRLLR
jgi:hypothetical protein